jgi:predicted GIY-YIG superfamily endonuclease
MLASLYILRFSNGKQYVGMTRGRPEHRLRSHVNDARAGSPLLVHRAIRKYGVPRLRVLMTGDLEAVAENERKQIEQRRTLCPSGYNLDPGGQYRTISPQERLSMSKRAKQQDRSHLLAPEVRAKKAIAMREVWKRPGFREDVGAKIAKANRGRKASTETRQRQRIAAALRWRNATPWHKERAAEGGRHSAALRWGKL